MEQYHWGNAPIVYYECLLTINLEGVCTTIESHDFANRDSDEAKNNDDEAKNNDVVGEQSISTIIITVDKSG